MENYRRIFPLYIITFLGIAAGFLRGYGLVHFFDRVTGLYKAGVWTFALPIFCGAVAFLVFLLAMSLKKSTLGYLELYRVNKLEQVLLTLCGGILVLAGAAKIFGFIEALVSLEPIEGSSIIKQLAGPLLKLCIGLLTALSGVSVVAVCAARARGKITELTAFSGVIPVFWGCFVLVLTFMEHPVEPILFVFSYDLIAVCAMLLALYANNALLYKKHNERVAVFSSLTAVFFLLAAGFGRLTAAVLAGDATYITEAGFRLAVSFAALLYCAVGAMNLLRRMTPIRREARHEV